MQRGIQVNSLVAFFEVLHNVRLWLRCSLKLAEKGGAMPVRPERSQGGGYFSQFRLSKKGEVEQSKN